MPSKSKVKFSLKKVRSKVIPIMKCIENGEYPTKIALLLGWSKQKVFYYIKKLEIAGLLYLKIRSNIAIYELTTKGKEFLKGCESNVFSSGVYRLHHCCVKYPIYKEGIYPKGSFREVELVNWTALLGSEHGVSVRKTTRHWIVECVTAYSENIGELFSLVMNLANDVANGLVKKYKVILGNGEIQKGYELAVDDPVAGFLSQYFEVSTHDRKIDHSELKGEIDHLSKDAAIEYLLMPERIERIEKEIIKVSSHQIEINDNFLQLLPKFEDWISIMSQLVNLLKNLVTDDKNESQANDKENYIC